MNQVIQLNKIGKSITGKFYRNVVMPIVENSQANYDINIVLLNNQKLRGRIVEIIEDAHGVNYEAYVILKFKFKTPEGEEIIDLFDIAFVWVKD